MFQGFKVRLVQQVLLVHKELNDLKVQLVPLDHKVLKVLRVLSEQLVHKELKALKVQLVQME